MMIIIGSNVYCTCASDNLFIQTGPAVGNDADNTVYGFDGSDDFKYNRTSESGPGSAVHDVIKDFNHGEGDKIDVADIDAQEHTSGNQAFQWINHAPFSAEGQVRSYFDGDDTVLEFNSNGSGGAEMEIVLLGHQNLGSADLVL